MLNVAIIILNWEDAPSTLACARTVLDGMGHCAGSVNSRLLIVDNGSSDRCVEALSTWAGQADGERVTLIINPQNLGFSAGMNKGIFAAMHAGPVDYFWLLNNDLSVAPGALSALAQSALQRPDVAVWGATVIDAMSGKVQCAGGCLYNRWLGREKRVFAGKDLTDVAGLLGPKLDYIYGAAMFIRGDVLSRLHGLNEEYFLFFEELDLAARLQPTERLDWCVDARVHHEGGGSSAGKTGKVFSAYHAALSAFKFTRRYHPLCLPSVVVVRILGLAIYALRYKSPGLALAPLRALRDFFRAA